MKPGRPLVHGAGWPGLPLPCPARSSVAVGKRSSAARRPCETRSTDRSAARPGRTAGSRRTRCRCRGPVRSGRSPSASLGAAASGGKSVNPRDARHDGARDHAVAAPVGAEVIGVNASCANTCGSVVSRSEKSSASLRRRSVASSSASAGAASSTSRGPSGAAALDEPCTAPERQRRDDRPRHETNAAHASARAFPRRQRRAWCGRRRREGRSSSARVKCAASRIERERDVDNLLVGRDQALARGRRRVCETL